MMNEFTESYLKIYVGIW